MPRQNGCHGPAFQATGEITQDSLVLPTLLIVVVNNIIRTWLYMTVESYRVANNRIGETVGHCLEVFYIYYGMVDSRDSEWLHHSMNVLEGLF